MGGRLGRFQPGDYREFSSAVVDKAELCPSSVHSERFVAMRSESRSRDEEVKSSDMKGKVNE